MNKDAMKRPRISYTPERFNKIKSILYFYDFECVNIGDWDVFDVIITNIGGSHKKISNLSKTDTSIDSFEEFTDIDKFIDRALQLEGIDRTKHLEPICLLDVLIPGNIVEYSDGRRRIVISCGGDILLSGLDGWIVLKESDQFHDKVEIVKVYKVIFPTDLVDYLGGNSTEGLCLIWEK